MQIVCKIPLRLTIWYLVYNYVKHATMTGISLFPRFRRQNTDLYMKDTFVDYVYPAPSLSSRTLGLDSAMLLSRVRARAKVYCKQNTCMQVTCMQDTLTRARTRPKGQARG